MISQILSLLWHGMQLLDQIRVGDRPLDRNRANSALPSWTEPSRTKFRLLCVKACQATNSTEVLGLRFNCRLGLVRLWKCVQESGFEVQEGVIGLLEDF